MPGSYRDRVRPPTSAVAGPIPGSGGSLGAIYAEFAAEPEIQSGQLRWITDSYARLATLCMEGGDGLSAALVDSQRDRLTGCLNHEGLFDILMTEVERAQREKHALACCFIDLDGFKAINDTHGHLAGNRVLAAAGTALLGGVRPYDAVGRFGGDEFVIVLPYAGAAAARRMVERIQIRIGAQVAASTGMSVPISVGVAEWGHVDSALDLLDAADRALIGAKHGGGARVVVANPSWRRHAGILSSLTRPLRNGRFRERWLGGETG